MTEGYTWQEVRERLGLSSNHYIQRLVTSGKLRKEGTGRQVRFAVEDVERLRAERSQRPTFQSDLYYTLTEACRLFDCGLTWFYEQVYAGKIQSKQFTRAKGYLRADVDALVAARAEARRATVNGPVNPEAFSRLYEALFTKLVCYMRKRFGYSFHEVEDIVQDEFVRLWREGQAFFEMYPEFTSQCNVMFYRIRMAGYRFWQEITLHQRGKTKLEDDPTSWLHPSSTSLEDQVVAKDELHEVVAACTEESPLRGRILLWRAVGYTNPEIKEYLHREQLSTWGKSMVHRESSLGAQTAQKLRDVA